MDDWVLWGFHPGYCDGEAIKLTGGTSQEVRGQVRSRTAAGWTVAIYRAGTAPVGLRALAAEAKG